VAVVLAASVGVSLAAIAGLSGFIYFAVLLLTAVPGLPLGFALFGRSHPAGLVTGSALGYAITSFVWWAVVFSGHPSTVAFGLVWAIAAFAAWAVARLMKSPLVALPPWSRRDGVALMLLLLLVPALVTRPFVKLGSVDREGNHLYRAYFIADFVWHAALTAELAKEDSRPRNPFLASERVHYYWTYFRIPATLAARTSVGVETALKVTAFATALLLVAAIYLAAWVALPQWPVTVATAVALTILCPSIEGLAAIVDVLRRGLPPSEVRDLNIDAIAAWAFKGLRIDNLPRTMWYTPQHGFSCALGVLAVPIAIGGGVRAKPAAIVLAGCLLGASLAFNPLLGAAFCGVYGITILADAIRRRAAIGDVLRHALAVVPVMLAFGWASMNAVGEGAGEVLHFGFWGLARNATLLTFLLQFGPILIPIAIALWPKRGFPFARMWPALVGVTLAILIMHLVALTVDAAWVGFRAGNLFLVLAPPLVAAGLVRLQASRMPRMAWVVALVVLVLGLPTTMIDAYNTQDVTNRHLWRDAERARGSDVPFDPATEYRWTLVITPEEWDALTWIRLNTPATAIVQAEPIVRGRETWSLIPTFAERRMASGNALPLLARPIYEEQNKRVRTIYATADARAAWQEAKALGIEYLYVDDTERTVYPQVIKFDHAPEFFTRVFQNREAAVYALRP
jgi:hypothetical protein